MASKLDEHRSEIAAALDEGVSANTLAQVYDCARSTMQSFIKKNCKDAIGAGTFADDQLSQLPTATEIPVVHRDYSDQEKLHVYPLGDIHLGSPSCAEDTLDEWLKYLVESEEPVSLLNTGDNLNCGITTSVSDTYTETLTVGEARAKLTEKFRPLAEKGILDGIIDGNHEERIYKAVGDSPNAAVAEALQVPYAPAALLVVYHVGDQEYNLYVRHGRGGGATMGAAVNRLEKQERIIDSDVYVSGHTHTQVAFPKNVFVRDGDTVTRKKRLFICSGSFVGYEDYAKVAGFAPAHIGAPRIFFDGRRHDIHASV